MCVSMCDNRTACVCASVSFRIGSAINLERNRNVLLSRGGLEERPEKNEKEMEI